MRTIFRYLIDFVRDHFNLKLYSLFALFTAALISVNYWLDFEDSFIDKTDHDFLRFSLFVGIHLLGYYGMLLIEALALKKKSALSDPALWIVSFLGFCFLSFERSFDLHYNLRHMFQPAVSRFIYRCVGEATGYLTLALPLIILYFVYFRNRIDSFYGVRSRNVNFKPYIFMLIVMIPLVWLASLTSSFIEFYPVYKRSGGGSFAEFYQIPEWVAVLIYEFLYLSDFFLIELFFRGFLIVGLAHLLGSGAILPMAVTYAILHFGKPPGETISSVFGGYILGVLALKTRNIWGGVFIHVGVALLMEVFAFLQN